MLDALGVAFTEIMKPWPLTLMLLGILGSSIFAALPGIGVLLLITIVMPYAISLDPYPAIALMLGIGAVSNTANTFPSVLIAVPGSAGSQATIVDGFPMAQKGEAKRAFGAAFSASAIGGIFGALVLLASLPILRPIVLSFGSPEFLVLVLWGLTAVGVLSGNAPLKGLLAALLGLLVSSIGMDNKTGIERFAFGGDYLSDGISLVLVGLGLFAVPEMIALSVRRTSISETSDLGSGTMQGIRDTFKNWWLVIRCSIVGVWVGVLPGLGSSVADWFAYAHAAQTEKNTENFGKGDVRGVIAPESSNNSKEGGALIPTIAFGIPGSTSLALMLVVFIAVGITPGSAMLTDQLPYTMAMIWILVIANVIAAVLAIMAAAPFAALSLLPFYIIVPMTLVLCVSSSYASHLIWYDVITFLVFSAIGYFMKLFDWPRPPFLVAVVLGAQFEQYLWLSNARYGWTWLLEPGVLAILVLVIVTLVWPMISRAREGKTIRGEKPKPLTRGLRIGDIMFLGVVMAAFTYAALHAMGWVPRAAMVVYFVAGTGLLIGVSQVALNLLALRTRNTAPSAEPAEVRLELRRTLEVAGWLLALAAGVYLVGFHITMGLFPFLYIRIYGGSWRAALFLTCIAEAFVVGVFDLLLAVLWPRPYLFELLGIEYFV
ncbi:MAG: tripartite tricarboxylate transporter permease [Alphaproteobacteria bacterium]|nr:tripartite tricarboxylate transporter permease [Alphaproteobacteria bacterium]